MRVVGLDIGGANLKGADAAGQAVTSPFAVWKSPETLPAEIGRLLAGFPKPDVIALTMTAELADCYRTKRDGVEAVLAAVEATAGAIPIAVWQTAGRFVTPVVAREAPLLVAAGNWHVLATFVGRFAPDGSSLLIDIGTTTTDLIPLQDGVPVATGRTDRERLQSGELVYSGVKRTPICALIREVPFRGRYCPVAAEFFATTLDVYLTLGNVREDSQNTDTADGRPATVAAAHDRLARCLCCDATEFSAEDALALSRFVAESQRRQIACGIDLVLAAQSTMPTRLLISGAGSFLVDQIVTEHRGLAAGEICRLSDHFSPAIAEAACAFALANLAHECDEVATWVRGVD